MGAERLVALGRGAQLEQGVQVCECVCGRWGWSLEAFRGVQRRLDTVCACFGGGGMQDGVSCRRKTRSTDVLLLDSLVTLLLPPSLPLPPPLPLPLGHRRCCCCCCLSCVRSAKAPTPTSSSRRTPTSTRPATATGYWDSRTPRGPSLQVRVDVCVCVWVCSCVCVLLLLLLCTAVLLSLAARHCLAAACGVCLVQAPVVSVPDLLLHSCA